ncbi:Utp14 protein-domain-containing protein [Aspergillus pseudoustus]|uniref:Utp14 protein-domain-containing protein n=1 Tax=Aspergillus pseudoustus TaxID=1810923 RepID=A0ABR4JSI5_9EURO
MPRKQTQQRGPRDDAFQKKKQHTATKRRSGKILNALSIAERENPQRHKIRRNRLGDDDDYFKRKRNEDSDGPDNKRRRTGDDEDDEDDDSNAGSDGAGRRWKIGVDSDNDSELDSDEAMGSSDEEKFEGFTFRGSSTFKEKPKAKPQKPQRAREINLSEGEDESDEDEGMDDDDDLGEDAIDLVAAWDMNVAEEAAEAKKAAAKNKKRAEIEKSDEDISGSEGDTEEDESESDDENDGSYLSMSDDDEGNTDGLSKLQSFVDSMTTTAASKATKKTKGGQEHLNPTEFGLTATRKLTVADLLSSVTDSRLKNSLKHVDTAVPAPKTSSGIPGKLDAPLAKRQQDRIERAAAYEKSKATLGRWLETVKANRRAEHLVFPLPDPDAQLSHRISVVEPKTDLESAIQNILVESGLADAQGKSAEGQVQEFEELQARQMPIEEIRARRAELRKHRDLMFREEVRSKRIKKIKSKSYRRVHRKEQERLEQKERQALLEAGVDLEEQDREANERRRAEARMGSKHKESKWAKSLKQTGRTAWDEDARHGAVELAQREEELRQRIEGKRVTRGEDEDYLGSSSESESENENPWEEQDSDSEKRKLLKKLNKLEGADQADKEAKGPYAKLLNLKFMQNAEAARREENDAEIRRLNRELQGGEESQSEAESEVGRRKFGHSEDKKAENEKAKKQTTRNEFEEAPGSDEEPELDAGQQPAPKARTSKGKPQSNKKPSANPLARANKEVPAQDESEGEEENPWLVQSSGKNRRSKADDSQQTVDITPVGAEPTKSNFKKTTASSKTKTSTPLLRDTNAESDSDDEDNVPVLLKNHDLVKRAFAGDEVVQAFEQEKLDTVKEEGDQVIDETLPGWGSWTGDGVSKKQKKRQKRVLTTIEGVKPEQRKDAKLSRVIINEKRIKKNNKYLATQLPHQYETKQQYERSLRVPIGPEWVTKETFSASTKPRVLIKQGVIKPMEKPMV